MRRLLILAVVLATSLIGNASVFSIQTREATLYDMFSGKRAVRTYVHPVTAEGSAKNVDTELLRGELVDAFKTRMTIDFDVVDLPRNADIEVKCELTEFFWQDAEEDTTGTLGRITRILLRRGDRARLQGVFTVRDLGQGEILFRRTLKATISGSDLTDESVKDNLSRRIVRIFFREAFSRTVDTGRI